MKLRIATRKSALALWQAEHVASRLRAHDDVDSVELVPLTTRGDEVLDRSLQKIGGKGLFIKELEAAIEAGDADLAVHSMKDVPVDMPSGFEIAAVLERGNPADALVSRTGGDLASLPPRARIGSSSLRRQAQLKVLRPDVIVEPLRGNVNTRLARLDAGAFDAIVLAAAGLERLGAADRISYQFPPGEMMPAAAQGVIGIECRAGMRDVIDVVGSLNHRRALVTTTAERRVARKLAGSCLSPLGAYASIDERQLTLAAFVALPDGSEYLRHESTGSVADAAAIADDVVERLLRDGAAELLRRAESMNV
ncbi:MAG: hydroxymethylbilane synthase [Woeseiaceae bacterium]|nr:hydroxymethylbilane synthase [Woeseiaceae bacterium]